MKANQRDTIGFWLIALSCFTTALISGGAFAERGEQGAGKVQAFEPAAAVKGWLLAHRPDAAVQGARDYVDNLPLTGQTVHRVKTLSPKGQPISIAFDGYGNMLADGGSALLLAEKKAQWKQHGAIREELWQLRMQAKDTDVLPVAIWLRADEPVAEKQVLLDSPNGLVQYEAAREEARGAALVEFAKKYAAVGGYELSPVEGAPAVVVDLTPMQIDELAWANVVGWMDVRKENQPYSSCTRTNWVDSLAAGSSSTGFDASDVRICLIEYDKVHATNNLGSAIAAQNGSGLDYGDAAVHARLTAGSIRSTSTPYGTGSGATLDISTWRGNSNPAPAFYWCGAERQDRIWNFSYSCNDALCMALLSYWSKTSPYPVITVPAGNGGSACTVTNKSYNTVTVGSVDDEGTSGRTDDSYVSTSCYSNPTMSAYGTTYTDWELPNVVAPAAADSTHAPQIDGYSSNELGPSCDVGTSSASAAVAGIVGQMFEANATDLNDWPERVRALLMCSADVDTNYVRISLVDQVDDTEGVGEVNATLATQFAASSNKMATGNTAAARGFDGGYMTAINTPNYNFLTGYYTARASTVTSTTKLRVILTWDASAGSANNCTNTSSASSVACDAQQLDADLDLYIYRHSDGEPMGACSFSATSNWEVVQFGVADGLEANVDYDIKIYAYHWYNNSTFYGIAWNFGDYPLAN